MYRLLKAIFRLNMSVCRVCVCICVCVCIYIYIYIYTHTHTLHYIHTLFYVQPEDGF